MTDKHLREIGERVKKATAGPWHLIERCGLYWVGSASDPHFGRSICDLDIQQGDDSPATPANIVGDGDFIAHSREDVEVLLLEVERLRAELKACDRAWADVAHNASEEIRKLADWQRRAAARLTADAQQCFCVGEDERCPQCCSRHALLDEVRRPAARR